MTKNDIILDMTKARRRKKRSKRSIRQYWDSRYRAFLSAGFTSKEASWGASNGLSLKEDRVKKLIVHRKALVALYMGSHFNYSREEAILESSKDLEAKLEAAGISELILYFEVSD